MMQTLLVDVGNSRIKWAMHQGGRLQASSAILHREREMSALLTQAWTTLTRPNRVVVASVANSDRKNQLADWVRQHWSLTPEFVVSPPQGQGVKNSYREPARLGCDRWAAMVAAYHAAHAAVCVVDCGSAVTLDVVDATGQHQGGLILPGVQAMHAALTRHTELAPIDFSMVTSSLLGNSTQEGIVCGITQEISALVHQTLSDLERTSGLQPTCYLTGGDAELMAPLLRIPYILEADLVLKGLAVIACAT
jgi:type III pantothenate kinase